MCSGNLFFWGHHTRQPMGLLDMKHLSLFNVNGKIGNSAYEESEFPDIRNLLVHMDYLGVDRSLVWHVEARDLNPTYGNRRLLHEIREAGVEQRLIPAFVITPACFFEDGVLPFLKANFGTGSVRALRITPDISRFPIRQIERLLAELAEFAPVLLWDCRILSSEQDMRDIELLAKRFPAINFVLTQKMWGGFGSVVDLMWRCPNIHVDISWLHMRDVIEFLIDNFGCERVVFGLGYKSHYGASIASLMHAQISQEQRELIAHGNMERLLQLEPAKTRFCSDVRLLEEKPLWCKFRSGKPIDNVPIIDAHCHTAPHTRGWFLRDINLEKNIGNLIKQMDRVGVNHMIIISETALFGNPVEGNRKMAQMLAPHRDRFSGYVGFNPRYEKELLPCLNEFFADGFYVGFKLLPSYWKLPVTDAGYRTVWEYADKHHLPILIHTWDDQYNSPAMLREIASRYHHAKFLLGHSGGGSSGRKEAEEIVSETSNVFLEFCGSFTTPLPFEESARKVGFDRVVFGTDTGAHSQAWELGRYLSMPIPDEQLIPALSANMQRILGERQK